MTEDVQSIDINRADAEVLETLPGVGPAMASRIIAARPFNDLEDLVQISGISTKTLGRIRPLVSIAPVSQEEPVPAMDGERFADEFELARLEPDEAELEELDLPVVLEAETGAGAEALSEPSPEPEILSAEALSEDSLEPELPSLEAEAMDLTETEPAPAEADDELEAPGEDSLESELLPVEAEFEEFPQADGDFTEDALEETAPTDPMGALVEDTFDETPSVTAPEPVLPAGLVTRTQAIWMALVAALFTLVLSLAITFSVLQATNGGLQYASQEGANALTAEIQTLQDQTSTIDQGITSLRTRMDNLETLSGRVTAVEQEAASLLTDLDTLSSEVGTMNETLAQVEVQIGVLQGDTEKYQSFLNGLYDFLHGFTDMEETQ